MHIVIGCLFFLVAFVVTRQLLPQGILFYQGLACASACALAQWVVTRRSTRAARLTATKDALLTFLLAYAFMFTVPTTVDRAYSVRLIQQLDQSRDGMSRAEMEDWFAGRFIGEGGVERRVREQLATGTLSEEHGRFVLTARGRWLAWAFGAAQRIFNCGAPS
ncbi:hypothetical protein LXT12_15145 [Pelomonas sp. P7]|uniref:Uncharacterized protein n=2 Tax=Roseateles TaxID=93681 RepID=A0ABS8XI10_9BURK|nr:hypothetical protein [Pelomonas sp. P7]MCE4538587.1 hypothetical protein [Pelomonas sp. P7]